MDEHLIINLRVADMRYPLRIKRKEEEVFRKAATEIDYKLGQYRNHFTGDSSLSLNDKEYMAMTAIQAVAEKVGHQLRAESFEARIRSLSRELEGFLKAHVR